MTRTHAYRTILLGCAWASSIASSVLAVVTVSQNFWPVTTACAVLGFCMTAIQAVALETAVEVTYPVSEGVSGGVILGIAVAVYCTQPFIASSLLAEHGVPTVLWGQCALLALASAVLTFTFWPTYKRMAAEQARAHADDVSMPAVEVQLRC